MKVLFITSSFEDYLQDQLIIGLRNLLGNNLVDYPKKKVLYTSCTRDKKDLYGRGFTIWQSLPEAEVDRSNIIEQINLRVFDLVIFGSIWRQKEVFRELSGPLRKNRIPKIFIDGEDHMKVYRPAVFQGKYFKREQKNNLTSFFVKRISFSIPGNKILQKPIEKAKMFARHCQCDEAYKLSAIRENCVKAYAFEHERDYYHDIATSRYAITMKKAGWDCMRHYEIAANLTIPCFYNLAKKPANCAPHGLKDMHNVISFSTAAELQQKISYIEENQLYEKMVKNVAQWIAGHKSEVVAEKIIH